MIHEHKGLKIYFEPQLDGDGREICPEFIRVVKEKAGKVKTAYEYCAGTAFIGFSLLAEGLCERLVLSDIVPESIECCRRTAEENGLTKRVDLFVSDCLKQIPPQKWDLVVANPPHFSEPQTNLRHGTQITWDKNWQIHRGFYEKVNPYLNPGATIIFVENGRGSNPELFYEMIGKGGLKFRESFKCNLTRPSKFYFMITKKPEDVKP